MTAKIEKNTSGLANPSESNSHSSNGRLPSVHDRPHATIVIYDGNCVFCSSQAARLAKWDRDQRAWKVRGAQNIARAEAICREVYGG